MDENRRTQTLYKTKAKFRAVIMTRRAVIDKIEVGPPHNPEELIEVTVRPRKICHKTPIQIGAEILQRGNLTHTAGEVLRTSTAVWAKPPNPPTPPPPLGRGGGVGGVSRRPTANSRQGAFPQFNIFFIFS